MNRLILTLALIFLCINSYAECRHFKTPNVQPKIENRSDEINPTDLIWTNGKDIPSDAMKYISKTEELGTAYFSQFDLNNDGQNEILIRSLGLSGSGGATFIFLEKQKGKWREIAAFTGGFILNGAWVPDKYNKKYLTITQWRRNGGEETFQSVWGFKNNQYEEISSQAVPLTLLYSKDFQKLLLDINWMCWKDWN